MFGAVAIDVVQGASSSQGTLTRALEQSDEDTRKWHLPARRKGHDLHGIVDMLATPVSR